METEFLTHGLSKIEKQYENRIDYTLLFISKTPLEPKIANANVDSSSKTIVKQSNNLKTEVDDTSLEGKSWWSILLTGFLCSLGWKTVIKFYPVPSCYMFFFRHHKMSANK